VGLIIAVVALINSGGNFTAQAKLTRIQSAKSIHSSFISRDDQRVLRTSDNIGEFSATDEERQWYELSMRRAKDNMTFYYWYKTGKTPQDIYLKFFTSSMDTREVATDPNFGTYCRYTKYYGENKKTDPRYASIFQ
ncbi:hypothetical protein JG688_00012346, partial [Phytophthora aleatoria]